ncbi:hypothetical protein KDI_15010 [Dictyobacter arantiisoli]|uniref:Uncharacterized protein n=1 Tax=Dictyobacter arantiisoli TaxID=2014874 RepID=A0A5A5T9D4_9CHLR|nr:hypothetical protein KDI_15010 [Dictyobacter arantiisoli]
MFLVRESETLVILTDAAESRKSYETSWLMYINHADHAKYVFSLFTRICALFVPLEQLATLLYNYSYSV